MDSKILIIYCTRQIPITTQHVSVKQDINTIRKQGRNYISIHLHKSCTVLCWLLLFVFVFRNVPPDVTVAACNGEGELAVLVLSGVLGGTAVDRTVCT